ncbi:MAG: hypothetical protein IKN67_03890 [Alphaproteobacteria bacterium]|nr:hypothetical protein [Alphaproteobacteria bacterium]
MNKNIQRASELLQTIQSMGLTPFEIKCLTIKWISMYPFLLEDFGWDIQIHARMQNVVSEMDSMQMQLKDDADKQSAVSVSLHNSDDNSVPKRRKRREKASVPSEQEKTIADKKKAKSAGGVKCQKAKKTKSAGKKKTQTPNQTEVPPRKGYSKNGKRLGRPPKKKDENSSADDKVKPDIAPKTSSLSVLTEEAKIQEQALSDQNNPEPKKEISPVAAATENTVSEAEIEQLRYGKEYEYDMLYSVNNVYVRTKRKLREEAGVRPIGVIFPYVYQNMNYEMVVYYVDEHAMIPLETAQKYARQKIKPYKEVRWRVKKSTDDAQIKRILPALNEMFKSMKGDELKGEYVDGRGQYYDSRTDGNLKIRYVCNIPLSD